MKREREYLINLLDYDKAQQEIEQGLKEYGWMAVLLIGILVGSQLCMWWVK